MPGSHSSVVAFNIGLFETPDGYSAYLAGADHYDEEDSDWVCNETFAPEERYFAVIERVQGKSWKSIQELGTEAAKAFLFSPEGKASFLATANAVTVGFDDGDLVRIV